MAVTGITGVADAYSATGRAWADGPGVIYDRLADICVALAAVPLSGRLVLDLGAGTGAASRAIVRAGGRVVAVDAAFGMLAVGAATRPPAAVGHALALPLRDRAVDGVVAAFSLNHLPDPVAGLREAARVTAAGGPVVASSYADDDTHPVKWAVDTAAHELGWRPPRWYDELRERAIPALARPDRVAGAAQAAGLRRVEVHPVRVPFPELRAPQLVAWRLGMAQLAPFVASLPAADRDRLAARAADLLGSPPPLERSIIVLSATAP